MVTTSSTPIGVLISNLGTPDAPTTPALRRYLKEFLWDPRVVSTSRPLWWLILNCIVLPTRPQKSAQLYKNVWTDAGSPLLVISRKQQQLLQMELKRQFPDTPFHVVLGMRYGNPSIGSALRELQQHGCKNIIVLPLYPQYAAATIGSTFDAVFDELKKWRWLPALQLINTYYDHPDYIAALADSVRRFWEEKGEPERLMLSFHGLPKSYVELGDPYEYQCKKTAEALVRNLALNPARFMVTFQSRFGREEWLQPYTDKTLEAWGKAGVKSVDVICPGFSADCLETLEEIEMQNRDFFLEAGGKQFRYIPALNDHPSHIAALAKIINTER
jgi:ferrochelatase